MRKIIARKFTYNFIHTLLNTPETMSKKDKIGAHGISQRERSQLRDDQVQGKEPEMMAANGIDANGYQIPTKEKHLFFIELEVPQYHPPPGTKLSTGFVQKYTKAEFESTKGNGGFAGYTTNVLHNPTNTAVTTEGGEGITAEKFGVAGEGIRTVDSNYAVMQDAYELYTGERPDESLTETQLDAAVKTARAMYNKFKGTANAPVAIDQSKAEANTPGVVVTPANVAAIVGANATEQGDKSTVADAAKMVAANTPPTQDGNTSVGQQTVAAADAGNEATTGTAGAVTGTDAGNGADDATGDEKGGEKGKDETPAAAATGRRGAPVATTRPSAAAKAAASKDKAE